MMPSVSANHSITPPPRPPVHRPQIVHRSPPLPKRPGLPKPPTLKRLRRKEQPNHKVIAPSAEAVGRNEIPDIGIAENKPGFSNRLAFHRSLIRVQWNRPAGLAVWLPVRQHISAQYRQRIYLESCILYYG
jgi:hypothetical protein